MSLSSDPVVDFYVLPSADPAETNYFICKLTEKILQQSKRIYIHCPQTALADELDTLLYSFRADSFLPHKQIQTTAGSAAFAQSEYPILIGAEQHKVPANWVVINLADKPYFLTRRVAEIVIQETSAKLLSRTKFSQYKERAFELRSHKM